MMESSLSFILLAKTSDESQLYYNLFIFHECASLDIFHRCKVNEYYQGKT
jgi:hypothetical protein